eukprot:TRINITY_DN91_c0_g1_i1.p1 TRINITY_DN91_c0_g1~~TRINITY_DN91_c0_g1_i1.p1  ORF type:complete len:327 (-),score=83.96 TRINITY_DN91_c0_g1_i1:37-1017(-)
MQFWAILVFCLVAVSARDLRAEFDAWKAEHGKAYETAEEHNLRFVNFVTTVKRIEKRNSERVAETDAVFGLNKFSDMTPEEFRAAYLLPNPIKSDGVHAEVVRPETFTAPADFDWRPKGVVTAVKDQEQCGSCWAFSATETIESAWMLAKNIKNTTFQPLAPQQIVDCDGNDDGCNGGEPYNAYDYVLSAGGMETEAAYPYTGVDGNCAFDKSKTTVNITGYKYATSWEDESTLKENLATKGPISICVDAANWQDYTSGIMTGWQCAWLNELDHCVQAVGYSTSGSTPYWIVRNSWNTNWGEGGFIRLSYGDNTCGLTNEATYVIV